MEKSMTQEDKELLLRDLCARLPYGVIVNYKDNEYDWHRWKISTLHALSYSKDGTLIDTDSEGWIEYTEYKGCGMTISSRPLHLEKVKPYLRPMSSMTEEEMKVLCNPAIELELKHLSLNSDGPSIASMASSTYQIDWLNTHHFDYRGLIEKGLALEAPEGMYA